MKQTINQASGGRTNATSALTVAVNNQPAATPFLEGGTVAISPETLQAHTLPSPAEGKTLIQQAQFIDAVERSLHHIFSHERIAAPQIRVSHPVMEEEELGVLRPVKEQETDTRPLYYEKLAFVIELPSIHNKVGPDRVTMAVGGTTCYDGYASYTGTGQRFHLFAGFTVKGTGVCCIFRGGLLLDVMPTDYAELKQAVYTLLCEYDSCEQLEQLERMHGHVLTEKQVAQLLGKARLYQHLPAHLRQLFPNLLFSDTQLDSIAKGYLHSERFKGELEGELSLWSLYNLFNEANRSSLIDLFLRRGANASAFVCGLASVKERKNYHWFLH